MGSFIRQDSLAGGEIGPSWYGRRDIDRYKTAARKVKNWLVTKSGSLLNRPGTRWVAGAYSNTYKSWLEQFYFSGDQTYVLEFSELKMRVRDAQTNVVSTYVAGNTVIVDGTNTVRISMDGGGTWSTASLPGSGTARAIADNGSTVVVVGTDYCATSTDGGLNWTQRTIGTITAMDIVWTGVNFIVVGSAGKFTASADGITWATVGTTSTAADWTSISYGNGQAVITGTTTTPAVYAACSSNPNAAYTAVTFGTVTNVSGTIAVWTFNSGGASRAVWTGQRWVFVYRTVGSNSTLFLSNTYSAVATTGTGAWTTTSLTSPVGPAPGFGVGQLVASWDGSKGYAASPTIQASSVEYTFTDLGVFTQDSTNLAVYRGWIIGTTAWYVNTSRAVYKRDGNSWTLVYTAPVLFQGVTSADYSTVAEITSPYHSADLPRLRAVQSGDVIYMFCKGYPTYKLTRTVVGAGISFTFVTAAPVPPAVTVAAPTRVNTKPAANDQHPDVEWSWCIVWADVEGNESLRGEVFTETASQCYPDRPVILEWNGVDGAAEYYIFRGRGGQWGYVGTKLAENGTGAEQFTDEGQVPDISVVPRTYDDVLTTDAPRVGAFYQDRLMVANTEQKPNTVRGSATSDYLNFDKIKFQREDSPLEFAANSRRFEEVRALVTLREVLVLTSESEASLSGTGMDPLTFRSVDYKTHSKRGCAWVEPVQVGDVCIYVQRDGAVLRDLIYSVTTDSYQTNELTMFIDHLLADSGRTIVDIAYAQHPFSTVWCVLSDGKVLSLSYLPELKQVAWAQHDFGGVVETVCSVFDGTEDTPWFTVLRGSVRQIERLTSRRITSLSSTSTVFMDDAEFKATGNSVFITDHIPPGVEVGVVQNGVYLGKQTTLDASGKGYVIGLANPFTNVWVGRIYDCDFESLDLAEAVERKKTVSRAYAIVSDTPALAASGGTLQAGEDLNHLSPAALASMEEGTVEINVETTNNPGGRVAIRLSSPVPMEIITISREVVAGQ
jgi:hypothetical protein